MKTAHLIVFAAALLAAATLTATPVGPAEGLLIKRRESESLKSRREGQTLFAVSHDRLARKNAGEKIVWRREEFGGLKRKEWKSLEDTNPSAIIAAAWDDAFAYLREHAGDVAEEVILAVEPEFSAYTPTQVPGFNIRPNHEPMPYWPVFAGAEGHLSDDYSQLASAYRLTSDNRSAATPAIRVAILDIGFLPYHRAFPRLHDPLIDVVTPNRNLAEGLPGEPLYPPRSLINGPAHGTATAAILAGPPLAVAGAGSLTLFSGGNPDVQVIPIRIGSSVVALPLPLLSRTGDVAAGFVRAADTRATVLSMSVGGLPSLSLADAVDEAYEAGVAMFCASGDYVIRRSGIKSPWLTVFPAYYPNVMSVVGVTAARTAYGAEPNDWRQLDGKAGQIVLGSFGPIGKMRHSTIAGWGPNIPWAALPDYPGAPGPPGPGRSPWDQPGADWSRLDRDGGGTSANAPQVAAAASLLLTHRHSAAAAYQEPWQRVEAVYRVLRETAERPVPANELFFGAGFLRARDALNHSSWPAASSLRHQRARSGFYWLRLLCSALTPIPSPAAPPEEVRQAAGAAVTPLLADLLGNLPPGAPLTQAMAAGIDTEIEQHLAASVELQDWLTSQPGLSDPGIRREFLDRLLDRPLSRPTRQVLASIRDRTR